MFGCLCASCVSLGAHFVFDENADTHQSGFKVFPSHRLHPGCLRHFVTLPQYDLLSNVFKLGEI